MQNEVLDYVNLNIDRISKKIISEKPLFNISRSVDSSSNYKIYKHIDIKNIEILLTDADRTSDIKERFENAICIQEYIKKQKDDFIALVNKCDLDKLKEIEEIQKKFEKKNPFFVRYEKNYAWQIYYSNEANKYFMLCPTKEGDIEPLFYLIKKRIEGKDGVIYVPICNGSYSEKILSNNQISDIENYLWLFTKVWPSSFEVDEEAQYIVGETRLQENLKTKYRIELNNKEEAEKQYTLLKALFVLTTESSNNYSFKPVLNEDGKIVFKYDEYDINTETLDSFVSNQTEGRIVLKEKIKEVIKERKTKLDELGLILKEQKETYDAQKKIIEMYINCKDSILKKIKFYFKMNKKEKYERKNKIIEVVKEKTKIDIDSEIEELNIQEIIKNAESQVVEAKVKYTIDDLIKEFKETQETIDELKTVEADIKAFISKKNNFEKRIKNAEEYIKEIEKHKNSLFDFFRFVGKNNLLSLQQPEETIKEKKIEVKFNLEEDFQDLALKADEMQRNELSIDECNAVFAAYQLLPSINSIVTKKDTYLIDEQFDELKKEYQENIKNVNVLGESAEEYSSIRYLKNVKHRESKRNLFSILQFNEEMTLDEFKEKMRLFASLINEAYKKITCFYTTPIYYDKKTKGYEFGSLDPIELIKDEEITKIYKITAKMDTHMLYFSNIIFYNNYNRTLPVGMDESSSVIIKAGNNKKVSETLITILMEKDLFEVVPRNISIIEEEEMF